MCVKKQRRWIVEENIRCVVEHSVRWIVEESVGCAVEHSVGVDSRT